MLTNFSLHLIYFLAREMIRYQMRQEKEWRETFENVYNLSIRETTQRNNECSSSSMR